MSALPFPLEGSGAGIVELSEDNEEETC